MEQWRVVPNTNGLYEISDLGRARRIDKGNILTPVRVKSTGYMRYCFSVKGKVSTPYVHALVAEAFIGPRPPGCDVNHKNGLKPDNKLVNLEYVARKQHEHHTRHVLQRPRGPVGENSPHAILTENDVRAIHAAYNAGDITQQQLAEQYGVALTTISGVLLGRQWKHLGLPRALRRKYGLKGLENPNGKVTPEMAAEIRSLHDAGIAPGHISKKFGIGRTTVYRVLNSQPQLNR